MMPQGFSYNDDIAGLLPSIDDEGSISDLSTKPIKPIAARALALAQADPARAWDVVSTAQRRHFAHLPLENFHADHLSPAPRGGMVRFVIISDTHSAESRRPDAPVQVPPGDVLLHCGDFTQRGDPREVAKFCEWFASQPHRHKVLIAGNHDLSLDASSLEHCAPMHGLHLDRHGGAAAANAAALELVAKIPNCAYLCDSGVRIHGIHIWGSPWQPEFGDWAFNLPRGAPCRERWRLIPDDADIVLTHGPPLGHGDLCKHGGRAGCLDLLDELQQRVRPAYHCFGHIHEGYGATTDGVTTYLNASTCNFNYRPDNQPLVFELEAKEPREAEEKRSLAGAMVNE